MPVASSTTLRMGLLVVVGVLLHAVLLRLAHCGSTVEPRSRRERPRSSLRGCTARLLGLVNAVYPSTPESGFSAREERLVAT